VLPVSVAVALVAMAELAYAQAPFARADVETQIEELYKSAFKGKMTGYERIAILEKVVFEQPKSKWKDDALWVIGEAYMQAKQYDNALAFKEKLLKEFPNCKLEPYTKRRSVYRKSSLVTMEYLFRASGYGRVVPTPQADSVHTYRPFPGVDVSKWTLSKFQFAPPMRVWIHEQIAYIYRLRKNYDKAAQHLRAAITFCPLKGTYYELLRKNLREVEARLSGPAPAQ